MNRNIVRALVLDAFYQVLDNWVFRILTGLTLIPILLTFVVGIREEGIVLLFGVKHWSYEELPFNLGTVADPQGTLIEAVLELFIGQVAGGLGILLSIAATAFFVPRLLEKGAAELYFHKPVSRTALFLSRYFAGLLFIALAGAFLVGGTFLGLALVSGRADAGILLAMPTLVYVFALVFPFTMLVGVVTRSTVASILLSGLFFVFNGCIQQAWISFEQFSNSPAKALLRPPGEKQDEEPVDESLAAEPEQERSGIAATLRTTLDVVRTILPKTSDADTFARKVRRSLNAPAFRDEGELVVVSRVPSGLRALDLGSLTAPAELRELLGTPRFGATAPDAAIAGKVPLRFSLWSRPIETSTSRIGERERVRKETASAAGEKIEDTLVATQGRMDVKRTRENLGDSLSAARISWSLASEEGSEQRVAYVFKGVEEKQIFTLLIEQSTDAPVFLEEVERITRHVRLDKQAIDEWYPAQVRFDAPWRTNIFFSIGSSLAFAAALLVLGLWRLTRIAF